MFNLEPVHAVIPEFPDAFGELLVDDQEDTRHLAVWETCRSWDGEKLPVAVTVWSDGAVIEHVRYPSFDGAQGNIVATTIGLVGEDGAPDVDEGAVVEMLAEATTPSTGKLVCELHQLV